MAVCACGHQVERDHKRTIRGEFFCWLCPDGSRCVDPDVSLNPTPNSARIDSGSNP